MVRTTIRGEEDKAVVLQISLERDINGELLCLCSAIGLGTAVGVSGHRDPGATPQLRPAPTPGGCGSVSSDIWSYMARGPRPKTKACSTVHSVFWKKRNKITEGLRWREHSHFN